MRADSHRNVVSQPMPHSQPPTTSVNQCAPRMRQVRPTSMPQHAMTALNAVALRGARSDTARISSPGPASTPAAAARR